MEDDGGFSVASDQLLAVDVRINWFARRQTLTVVLGSLPVSPDTLFVISLGFATECEARFLLLSSVIYFPSSVFNRC